MQRNTMITMGTGALALAALLVWAFRPQPAEVELAAAHSGRFETTIDEEGKTRLRERFVVSAPLSGRLARITLVEGDAVQAGALLAQLTPVMSPMIDERSQREAAARVAAGQAAVAGAGSRIARAQVGLEQARAEIRRSEQLAQQGFVAPTKLETDRLAERAAMREVEAAVQQRHVAEHELELARVVLGAVPGSAAGTGPGAGKAGAFAVRAPVAGRVLRVLQASETTVALGTPLLEIGDIAALEVVAELLTADALQAGPGSRVRIERWGGPQALQGLVKRVEPAAFTKVSALGVEEQRVRVLIDITSPPQQWQALGDGYRVGVRIVTQAVEQALMVPVSAVFPLPAGASATAGVDANGGPAAQHAVFLFEGGRARLTPVQLGGRNASDAWVRSGLQAGAQVVVYPPNTVIDGARVKVRKV